MIPVNEIAQLFDVARVLESQPLPPGDRVVVLSNAHGVRALAEGALMRAGLQMAELAADSRATSPRSCRGRVGHEPGRPHVRGRAADYDGALRCVLADDAVDLALVIYASAVPARLQDVAAVIVAANADNPTKPVVASVLGVGDRGLRDNRGHGVPSFAFPETAAATLARVTEHARWKRRPEGIVPDVSGLGIDIDRATSSSLTHSR